MRAVVMGIGLVVLLAGTLPAAAQEFDRKAEVRSLSKEVEKLKAVGKLKEAEEVYEKALARAQIALGKHHPYAATALNDLALLYQDMGQYAKAEPLYQRSLGIRA